MSRVPIRRRTHGRRWPWHATAVAAVIAIAIGGGAVIECTGKRDRASTTARRPGPQAGARPAPDSGILPAAAHGQSPRRTDVPAAVSGGVPVTVTVDKACLATVVIESEDGERVSNLVSEMPVAQGANTFVWDLMDVGWQKNHLSPYVRRRVAPGTYRVRGLTFDYIVPKYEFSVYSQGTPPWRTHDNTGCWMADHTAPSDALFLPADHKLPWGKGVPLMVLTSSLAESGNPTVYTDLEGKVVLAHGLCGKAVARDAGTGAVAEHALYFANTMEGFSGRQGLLVLKTDGGVEQIVRFDFKAPVPMSDEMSFVDVAVRDGVAVVSNSENRDNVNDVSGNLLVVDVRTKKVLANHGTPPTRGVCFGPDGKLYVVVGDEVRRYSLDPRTGALDEPVTVIRDLPEPRRVRCDGTGNIYVGVWDRFHQIRVYDPRGALLRTIGKPGGEQIGKYDELRMQRPDGFAIDPKGRIWVAENCLTPKRISIWRAADGSFLRAIYGRVVYGGGGAIDPYDRTRFYYPSWTDGSAMLFRLDWDSGTWRPETIYYRVNKQVRDWSRRAEGTTAPQLKMRVFMDCDPPLLKWNAIPIWGARANGRRFVVVRAGPGFMQHQCTVWNLDGEIARPVGALGITWSTIGGYEPWLKGARRYDELRARFEAEKDSLGWAWSDLDADGTLDPEEFQFLHAPGPELDGFDFKPDLSAFGFSLAKGVVPAPTFTAQGIPVWDLAKVEPLPVPAGLPESRGTPLLASRDVVLTGNGWEMITNILGFRRDGTRLWSYRVYQSNCLPQFPGQVVAGYRAAGPVMRPPKGEAGEIWCTHGLKGAVYLFTTDGLFLRTLGGDMRTTPLWRTKECRRGMPIEGVSFEDEDFGITIQQTEDGNIYLVAGKEHSSILRIDGLETVKRCDWGSITVTAEMLAGLPETTEELQPTQTRKELDVLLTDRPPIVDGRLNEWQGLPPSAWAKIDARTSAAVLVAGERIYAAFRTGDPRLLENSPQDWRYAFKGGGALDLFLTVGPDNEMRSEPNAGDCRLLVTRINGRPTAILYRQVGPADGPDEKVSWVDDGSGTGGKALQWVRPRPAADESCVFQSPIGRVVFASVTDVSSQLELAQSEGDYELSIPLHTVIPVPVERWGHQPWREQYRFVVGDLGIIRGNGTQNIQRVCWNNLDTVIVSDIPSEVRLKPQFWGQWNLVPFANVRAEGPEPVACPEGAKRGLAWDYWEAETDLADEPALRKEMGGWAFLARPPKASGVALRPDIGVRARDHGIGLRFRGYLVVPADGWYRFDVWGRSGARLVLGGIVLSDVAWWSNWWARYPSVRLRAGAYPVEIDYWNSAQGSNEFQVKWTGPGFAATPIPDDAWRRAP